MIARGQLREVTCRQAAPPRAPRIALAVGTCGHPVYCSQRCASQRPERIEVRQARCISCEEFLGFVSAACTHAIYCSVSCTEQRRARKDEARDSMMCEQAASGVPLGEIAAYHRTSPQVAHTIIKAF